MDVRRSLPAGLAMLLLLGLTLIYWNHFDNDFHFDDSHTIENNDYITDLTNLPRFFSDLSTASSLATTQDYRPVVTSMNAIDYWIADGLDPFVFHVHIYIVFLILLVFLFFMFNGLMRRATGESHAFLALFSTAFFAFHTTTAETVNYIIARSDILSTLMVVLGVLLFMGGGKGRVMLGLIVLTLGGLTNLSALMLAPLLLLFYMLFEGDGTLRTLPLAIRKTAVYFLGALAVYVFVRWMVGGQQESGPGMLEYLATQQYVVWLYLKTFLFPSGLTADSDLVVFDGFFVPQVLWGIFVVLGLIYVAWRCSKQKRTLPISFGLLWFLIALIPTSSFVPSAEIMSHNRTFMAYIGLVLASSWGVFLAVEKWLVPFSPKNVRFGVAVVSLLFLVAHGVGTHWRNQVWDSERSLWYDVTIKSPGNGRGLMNFGLALMKDGEIEGAIYYFNRARGTSYGLHPYLYTNLGIATGIMANREQSDSMAQEAEKHFLMALDLAVSSAETHYYYGRYLHQNARNKEAINYVKRAIQLSPGHVAASALKINIESTLQTDIASIVKQAEATNTAEAFLDLSLKYYQLGDFEACISASEKALALRPRYAFAFNNICAAHNALGQYQLAIDACAAAVEIEPGYELAKGNLNWAKSRLK